MKPATLPQPLPMLKFFELIVNMIEDATAMPRDSIHMSEQDALQAEYPFCAVQMISLPTPLANDSNRVKTAFDDTAPANKELTVEHRVPMNFTMSVRFEVGPGDGADGLDDNANPECNASALMTAMMMEIRKVSRRSVMNSFGLALVRSGTVTDISAVISGEWISRANVDLIFAARGVVEEKLAAVDSASGAGTIADPSGPDVTSSFSATVP